MPTSYQTAILAESNLKCFYPLNETSGTVIHDLSANALNATLTASTVLKLGAQGIINNDASTAISDNGTANSGYITTPSMGITSGAFSLEFWCYIAGVGGTSTVLASVWGVGSSSYLWAGNNTAALAQFGGTDNFTSTVTTFINTRYHMVYVYDGTLEYWYTNGVQTGSKTPAVTPTWTGAGTLFLVFNGTANYWTKGVLQNVAAYTKALTQASISQHYALGNARALASGRTRVLP
jgi:hypothetical protein